MIEAFALVGAVTVVGIIAGLVAIGIDISKDKYKYKCWEYKYKHRFDKPPLAECYCKDCVFSVNIDATDCVTCKYEGEIADDRFCWRAEPKLFDPEDGE